LLPAIIAGRIVGSLTFKLAGIILVSLIDFFGLRA
jgi:hypothetical protein